MSSFFSCFLFFVFFILQQSHGIRNKDCLSLCDKSQYEDLRSAYILFFSVNAIASHHFLLIVAFFSSLILFLVVSDTLIHTFPTS